MAIDHQHHENDDPLEHVSGSIGGSEFIGESTMIPESGLVLVDEQGREHGPQVVEGLDHEGAIPESVSVGSETDELPSDKKDKGAALKKNLPMVIFGVIAAGLVAVVGVKALGGGNQQAQATQASTAVSAPTVQAPVAIAPIAPSPKPALAASSPEQQVASVTSVSSPTAPVASAAGMSITPVPSGTSASSAVVSAAPVNPVATDDIYSTKGMSTPTGTPVSATGTGTGAGVTTVTTVTTMNSGTQAPAPVAAATSSSQAPTKTMVTTGATGAACTPVACESSSKPAAKKTSQRTHSAHAAHGHSKAKKKEDVPEEDLPSTDGYSVHMGANGLAWITLPSGESRIVSKGDQIEGLGVVKEVDAQTHKIRVGRVTLR